MKEWQAQTTVTFPKTTLTSPSGTSRMGTRLIPASTVVAGVRVDLSCAESSVSLDRSLELEEKVTLTCYVMATTIEAANEAAQVTLGTVVDSLSLQLFHPLRPSGLEIVDFSAPRELGDLRAWQNFAWFDRDNFYRTHSKEFDVSRRFPRLPVNLPSYSTRVGRSLDWFLKSLDAEYDVDRFIFLWISIENLAKEEGLSVTKPLTLKCQHVLQSCPDCHSDTSRIVQGPSMEIFLQAYDVSQADSKALWRARQILHGDVALRSEDPTVLYALIRELRMAVWMALKTHIELQPDDLTSVNQPPVLILKNVSSGGDNYPLSQEALDQYDAHAQN